MSDVYFQILSPLPLNRHQDARKLFQIWAENAFRFFPNRSGLYEPLRHHFSLSSLEEAIRTWEFSFLVDRTVSPKLKATINMQYGPHRRHSYWSIGLKNVKDFEQPAFCRMLECAAAAFSVDFGLIHRITEMDMSRGLASGTTGFLDTARTERMLHVSSLVLKRYVPDIYWMTVFGKPYVELFSRERLLSCPAHRVQELDNGQIVVQLTPELRDTATEEAAFERVRQDARNHLNNDAFFNPIKGLNHPYRVPEFVWGPILH
jgi:hypothetical protein